MENFGGEVAYPTIEQICEVNRRMISASGGFFVPPDNLNNEGVLKYILDGVSARVHGLEMYPSLKEKAAAIAYKAISRHPFNDGNKRTAVHTAWEFLRSNGIPLVLEPSIVDLAESIARGQAGYDSLLQWLHDHQEE